MRTLPPRFKKKIDLLLREILTESEEFARAYAPEVERSVNNFSASAGESSADSSESLPEGASRLSYFGKDTPEFASAVKKVPQRLLELFYEQLRIKPMRYVRGLASENENEKVSPKGELSGGDGADFDISYGTDSAEEDEE